MKLVLFRQAQIAVPPGGGLAAGLRLFTDPEFNRQTFAEAVAFVEQALAVAKTAPDNPYGEDDEAIAAAIFDEIETRRQEQLWGGGVPGQGDVSVT